jgi:hypothetical protein
VDAGGGGGGNGRGGGGGEGGGGGKYAHLERGYVASPEKAKVYLNPNRGSTVGAAVTGQIQLTPLRALESRLRGFYPCT